MTENPKVINRPYVILNAAMSLDGKIATVSGNADFSSDADWKRVHKLRTKVDALMVGINTILKDDPKIHIKHYTAKKLLRIIIDSKARTPLNAKVLQMDQNIYPTLIVVTKTAPESNIAKLKEKGAQIFEAGDGDRVDLKSLMVYLLNRRISKILLEGGGNLNFSMLQEGLVDEVVIAIAPVIVGGKDAITLIEGIGAESVQDGFQLEFKQFELLGNNIVLHFFKKKSN